MWITCPIELTIAEPVMAGMISREGIIMPPALVIWRFPRRCEHARAWGMLELLLPSVASLWPPLTFGKSPVGMIHKACELLSASRFLCFTLASRLFRLFRGYCRTVPPLLFFGKEVSQHGRPHVINPDLCSGKAGFTYCSIIKLRQTLLPLNQALSHTYYTSILI